MIRWMNGMMKGEGKWLSPTGGAYGSPLISVSYLFSQVIPGRRDGSTAGAGAPLEMEPAWSAAKRPAPTKGALKMGRGARSLASPPWPRGACSAVPGVPTVEKRSSKPGVPTLECGASICFELAAH
jgi:hypothetical protein